MYHLNLNIGPLPMKNKTKVIPEFYDNMQHVSLPHKSCSVEKSGSKGKTRCWVTQKHKGPAANTPTLLRPGPSC